MNTRESSFLFALLRDAFCVLVLAIYLLAAILYFTADEHNVAFQYGQTPALGLLATLIISLCTVVLLRTKIFRQSLGFVSGKLIAMFIKLKRLGRINLYLGLSIIGVLAIINFVQFSLYGSFSIRYLGLSNGSSMIFYIAYLTINSFVSSVLVSILIAQLSTNKRIIPRIGQIVCLFSSFMLLLSSTGIRPMLLNLSLCTFYMIFSFSSLSRPLFKILEKWLRNKYSSLIAYIILSMVLLASFSYLQEIANNLSKGGVEAAVSWNIERNSSHLLSSSLIIQKSSLDYRFSFDTFARSLSIFVGDINNVSKTDDNLHRYIYSILNQNSRADLSLFSSGGASPGLISSSLLLFTSIIPSSFLSTLASPFVSSFFLLLPFSFVFSIVLAMQPDPCIYNCVPLIRSRNVSNYYSLICVLISFLLLQFVESPLILILNPFTSGTFQIVGFIFPLFFARPSRVNINTKKFELF